MGFEHYQFGDFWSNLNDQIDIISSLDWKHEETRAAIRTNVSFPVNFRLKQHINEKLKTYEFKKQDN